MSHTFDTVQRALSLVRDASNLTKRQKELISFSQDVIDQWHSENHKLDDAINRNSRAIEATYYLKMVIEEKDPEKRLKKMESWIKDYPLREALRKENEKNEKV